MSRGLLLQARWCRRRLTNTVSHGECVHKLPYSGRTTRGGRLWAKFLLIIVMCEHDATSVLWAIDGRGSGVHLRKTAHTVYFLQRSEYLSWQ